MKKIPSREVFFFHFNSWQAVSVNYNSLVQIKLSNVHSESWTMQNPSQANNNKTSKIADILWTRVN